MRLTLRVLMAYLDDVLTPQQIRDVGQRIQESNVAKTLIERIRTQMKRRRISAVDALQDDPEFTAQEVASYLNNELPPEQVAKFEQKCIEIDQRLIEVAATHQILSLVVGEPVEVPEITRKRMYDLIETHPQMINSERLTDPPSSHELRVRAVDSQQSAVVSHPAVNGEAQHASSNSLSIDDYMLDPMPRKRSAAGLWSLLAVAAVVVWGGLIFTDSSIWSGFIAQSTPQSVTDQEVVNLADQTDGNVQDSNAPSAQPHNADQQEAMGLADGNTTTTPPVDPEKLAALPESLKDVPELAMLPESQKSAQQIRDTLQQISPSDPDKMIVNSQTSEDTTTAQSPNPPAANETSTNEPAADQTVQKSDSQTMASKPSDLTPANDAPAANENSSTEQLAMNKPDDTQLQSAPDPAPPKPEPPAPFPDMTVQGNEKFLVIDKTIDPNGYLVNAATKLDQGDLLVVPALNEAVVSSGESNFQLLVRESSAIAFPASRTVLGESLPQFKLLHGRMVMALNESLWTETNQDQPAQFQVQVDQQNYTFGITTPQVQTVAGLSVQSRLEAHVSDPSTLFGLLVQVAQGELSYTTTGQPKVTIKAGESLFLPISLVSESSPTVVKPTDVINAIEPWVSMEPAVFTLTQRRQLGNFLKEISDINQVWFDLEALAATQNPTNSELAVKTLGLGDKLDGLVASLIVAPHEEAHLAAVKAIRSILYRDPGKMGDFEQALQSYFPHPEVSVIVQLMVGYPSEAGKDPQVSQQLVDFLSHEQVVIRELAIDSIEGFTGRRYDFRPHAPLSYRIPAVGRWQQHIDREGALVKP